ncbi:MAG: adenylate/guanylate cyclase domain-containing protein [Chthonomonas sp.]|nr:adenylate/guanylate cyclase domain-containing protein [Chthonomonas sp.]
MTTQSTRTEDAAKLAEYIRQNPQAIYGEPEMLAREARVDLEVVQRSIRRASIIAPIAEVLPPPRQFVKPKQSLQFVSDAWNAFMRDPAVVVPISFAPFIVANFILRNSGTITNLQGVYQYSLSLAVPTILLLVGLALQAICYFIHGQARKVVRGSIALYVVSTAVALAALLVQSPLEGFAAEDLLMPFVGFGFLTLLYSAFGMIFSMAGGYLRMRLERADRNRMDRQELLEQLFDIQERLQETPEEVVQRHSWHSHPIAQEIEAKLYEWSALLGFGLTAITVLVAGAVVDRFKFAEESVQYAFSVGFLGFIGLALQLAVAFLGRRFARAILASVIFTLSSFVAMLLPFGGFGVHRFDLHVVLGNLAWALIGGLVAGAGAAIEYRANVEYLMRLNDPETLLVEYMDLQRRLNPGPRDMTVLVVDAAKSSMMKSTADPFVAEWSFRAYQQFLERQAEEHQGEILSTAGDGAVMAFHDPRQALECARDIQRKIKDFNSKTNKLDMPFSLRIGLHRGMVVGQIDKVQYTDVIDIAAHVEAACKVGGIAVSEKVWEAVPDLKGEPIAIPIDGFSVFQLELV